MGDAQPIFNEPQELDLSHIQTEDGEPVDNIFSEKQMRLLTESLYASWRDEQGTSRVFAAFANVGLFYALHEQPVVPDVMVALDVVSNPDPSDKKTLSYFMWEFGKPPDIVVEIVSNREGGEDTSKMLRYAQIGVTLEIDDAKFGDTLKNYMPAIRSNVLMLLSHKTAADLLSLEGKQKLAKEIKREALLPLGIEVEEEDDVAAAAEKEAAPKKKKKKRRAPVAYPITAVHFSNLIIQ